METTGKSATKLTLYIAGPEDTQNNFTISKAESELEKRKIYQTIINPAKIDQLRDDEVDIYNLSKEDMNQILTEDFILLMSCDSIYMLRGWENGRVLELNTQSLTRMYIEYQ